MLMPASLPAVTRRARALLAVGGTLALLGACSEDPSSPDIRTATVAVTPRTSTVAVGGTVQLSAQPRDIDGQAVTGRTVTWSSVDPAIATVSETGVVTGVRAGSTAITATVDGRSGSAVVEVLAPVATVTIEGITGSTISVGTSAQLRAVARDAAGNALNGRALTWSTSNATVASVSANGLLSALAEGTTTITASVEGRTGTLTLTAAVIPTSIAINATDPVIEPGTTRQLSAVVRDGQGNAISRPVTWSSSNANVVSVNATTGLATAGPNAGSATITARFDNLSSTITLWQPFPGDTRLVHNVGQPIAGPTDDEKYFYIFVPPGRTNLTVTISGGTGDVDLYVFAPPTWQTITCRSEAAGNTESCSVANPVTGLWYVLAYGYTAYTGATLRATLTPAP
jgi:uncharacterized protein YjdB